MKTFKDYLTYHAWERQTSVLKLRTVNFYYQGDLLMEVTYAYRKFYSFNSRVSYRYYWDYDFDTTYKLINFFNGFFDRKDLIKWADEIVKDVK